MCFGNWRSLPGNGKTPTAEAHKAAETQTTPEGAENAQDRQRESKMNGQGWEFIRQLAIVISTLVAGGPGVVWAVNQLKLVLGFEGKRVWWLAAGVSLVAALAGAIVDGLISPDTLAVGNIAEITIGVFIASQTYYRMIERQKEKHLTRWVERQQEA